MKASAAASVRRTNVEPTRHEPAQSIEYMSVLPPGKRRAMFRARAVCPYLAASILASTACQSVTPTPVAGTTNTWAFTAPWDPRSDSSLRANAARLGVAVTGWIQLDSVTGLPELAYADEAAPPVERFALLTSWQGQRFHPEVVRRLASNQSARMLAAARTAQLVARGGYRGLIVDWEGQGKEDLEPTVRLLSAVADSARRHGARLVGMAIPATDTAAYPAQAFIPAADVVVVMLYDEHWSTSAAGPVASPLWVRRALSLRLSQVGASRIVAGLPVYGYLWRGTQPAEVVGFADARRAATESGVELVRDATSRSLHATRLGGWELWLSDAGQLGALEAEVSALGVSTVALWRLGLEDPAVWRVLGR